jgi:hydrogenase maturation protein HypF
MGRLFDAVASLVDIRQTVAYEAQAAIELEGLSRDCDSGATEYTFAVDTSTSPAIVDQRPVVAAVVADARAGVPKGVIGARFHRAVAELVIDTATSAACAHTVALSGGVFQNTLLLRLVVQGLRDRGFAVITHRLVPPNDGGIALGQLLVGNYG